MCHIDFIDKKTCKKWKHVTNYAINVNQINTNVGSPQNSNSIELFVIEFAMNKKLNILLQYA